MHMGVSALFMLLSLCIRRLLMNRDGKQIGDAVPGTNSDDLTTKNSKIRGHLKILRIFDKAY